MNMINRTAESKKGRPQRTQNLLDDISETQRLNLVGIEFLRGIIEDYPDRVYHGIKERPESNLIVRGDLANYCIPLEPILQAFTNPFTAGMGQTMPPVEVHPLGKWVRRRPRLYPTEGRPLGYPWYGLHRNPSCCTDIRPRLILRPKPNTVPQRTHKHVWNDSESNLGTLLSLHRQEVWGYHRLCCRRDISQGYTRFHMAPWRHQEPRSKQLLLVE